MQDPLHRLWRTQLTLLATVRTVSGIAVLVLARWASTEDTSTWLTALPISEVGSALFVTGPVAILFEYIDAKDADERATKRLRRVLAEEAPAIRDAVIHGFAFQPDDLAKVASLATLDQIVRNSLAIQLGDRALAKDVYADVRTQVLRTPERHTDMRVSVTLTPWEQGPTAGSGSMFVATVRREYGCSRVVRSFVFPASPTSTEVWHFEPIAGLSAISAEAYQLLLCTVDGKPRPIRRSKRASAQLFTVDLGQHVETG